jgi:hypothetical protein
LPGSKTPAQPVTIEQQKCVYTPRVVGARVGQILRVKKDVLVPEGVLALHLLANQ